MPALDGKVAIVTGGSSSMGAAIATLFVAEGARVLIRSGGCQNCCPGILLSFEPGWTSATPRKQMVADQLSR